MSTSFYYYLGYPLDFVYIGDPLASLSPEALEVIRVLLEDLKTLDADLASVVQDSVATVVGKMTLDPLRAEAMMRARARSIVQRLSLLTSVDINSDLYASGSKVQWRVPG